jgi:hypothetical protein
VDPHRKKHQRKRGDYKLTHISPDEALKAARIAAAKFFSTDSAITRGDLIGWAAIRILDRDPDNMPTAVHVGREGIMRELGYRKYEAATNTIEFSAMQMPGSESSSVEDYYAVKPVTRPDPPAGKPAKAFSKRFQPKKFGRYGLQFDGSAGRLPKKFANGEIDGRPAMVIRAKRKTASIRKLAEFCFVLVVPT